jgi:CheY-like chemotaxis protein
VAKILVADDNSNIQKMVVLALKDQGIDVVAVGNGEAAVRKISDIRPDLVLADVFMPVRNGYEVCKYVKDDSSLSHIPVILLVGAFDPLDEQEAQRVGADGVLKKPFVPPDPLISMVKAALTRAGVVIGTSVPPPPIPVAKAEPTPIPRVVPPPVFTPEPEPDTAEAARYSSRPAPVNIDEGHQPLAFGSLLEAAPPDDDAVFAISPIQTSTPDRNWGTAEAEETDVEEETAKTGGWRVSSIDDTMEEAPAGQTDWREAAFSGIGTEKAHGEGWAPSVENNSLSITEEEAVALAKNHNPFLTEADQGIPTDWSKAIAEVLPAEPPAVAARYAPEVETTNVAPPPTPEAPEPHTAAPSPVVNSWMAGAVSPWEAEIQRASQLASTWDTAKSSPAALAEENSATEAFLDSGLMAPPAESTEPIAEPAKVEEHSSVVPAEETIASVESLLSPETQEVLQEETAQVVAEEVPAGSISADSNAALPTYGEQDPSHNMDEIVAKVLARMNPEVLQTVTREILKPLVEAMIKDELQKK